MSEVPGNDIVSQHAFNALRALIASETGIVLSDGKRNFIAARLQSRLRRLQLRSYDAYYDYARENRDEIEHLVNAVTTNKTSFFREEHHFTLLATTLVPSLIARAAKTGRKYVRIWSAGCSSGEEAYSIAMVLHRHLPAPETWDVRILASDIDTNVLTAAKNGIYPAASLSGVPADMRRAYFEPAGKGEVQVAQQLRSMVRFDKINLNGSNWPTTERFDAIFCRNVVIYFDQQTQRRLFTRFASMLGQDSFLLLGHSETLNWMPELFKYVSTTAYRLAHDDERATRVSLSRDTKRDDGPPSIYNARRITVGQVFATRKPTSVRTLLGSCIAACIYDPTRGIGGMNHFLLPAGRDDEPTSARFGVHAMELLINAIMRQGGDRLRLEAKVFGGAHVLDSGNSSVPEKNIAFIREFLETEKIVCRSELLGGHQPLDVCMFTDTGRVLVRRLAASDATIVAAAESRFAKSRSIDTGIDANAVTLFG